ncbi:panthothenate kinase [Sanguibacter keddieii DSM 10542]|uniref:Panthothenate kinase n=1 Tax=Sanguibacter keddieii (strain ATCC 51767 / DSM 10542 / NCFB 3025 / ST-74) TaxID=446469 RepID=D1BBQ7_SANKS|nr:nucleoside/nucleotide kinase family protein [Sanguibacter keddieii]ACZ22828.1 panthothenate kinase [Sanguibacter keddieii DSM 10542]
MTSQHTSDGDLVPGLVVDLQAGLRQARSSRRYLLGIAGAPGAGKSTLAERLVDALRAAGVPAVLVPMDGFHLAQRELDRLDRADRKGAPDTFDVGGYVALLARLRDATDAVYAPEFRREIEEPVAGAVRVGPEVEVVVTEGNYLLLDDGPWSAVRDLLDQSWFLEVPDALRRERLVARHERYGRSPHDAREWALGPDERNAVLVAASAARADRTVRLADEG